VRAIGYGCIEGQGSTCQAGTEKIGGGDHVFVLSLSKAMTAASDISKAADTSRGV
jgi:hypothetical protein